MSVGFIYYTSVYVFLNKIKYRKKIKSSLRNKIWLLCDKTDILYLSNFIFLAISWRIFIVSFNLWMIVVYDGFKSGYPAQVLRTCEW